jgi:hypothetical protein
MASELQRSVLSKSGDKTRIYVTQAAVCRHIPVCIARLASEHGIMNHCWICESFTTYMNENEPGLGCEESVNKSVRLPAAIGP